MTVVVGSGNNRNKTVKADTLARFIQRTGEITAERSLCFRGLAKGSYPLLPSLDRPMVETDPKRKWSESEYKLVEFSEQRFPDRFVKRTPALLIANMQHYGIPTRMMDVTGNALVALYFACDSLDEDGQVIVFDSEPVSAYNPYVNAIADTYRITQNSQMNVATYRYLVYKQVYFSSLQYPNWETDKKTPDENIELVKKPLVVDVGALNQRQINQNGKFIIFPNRFITDRNGREYISNELIKIEKDSKFIKKIVVIPKESKTKILDQLKICGITGDFLFPDDTEKVCNAIKQTVRNTVFRP